MLNRNNFYPLQAKFCALLCTTLLLATGCNGGVDEKTVDNLGQQIDAMIAKGDQTIEAMKNSSPEDALSELKKLRQWEYRVVKLPLSLPANEQEGALNSLGAEGWECFDPYTVGTDLRLLCKRRPETPLRYVPNSLLGR